MFEMCNRFIDDLPRPLRVAVRVELARRLLMTASTDATAIDDGYWLEPAARK